MFMVKKESVFFSWQHNKKISMYNSVLYRKTSKERWVHCLVTKAFFTWPTGVYKKQFELQADILSDAWVIIKVINYNGGGGEMKSFTDLAHFSTHLKPINFIKKSENHFNVYSVHHFFDVFNTFYLE